jgi:formylglycine-generating enzyme required for sulfatase activity
MRQVGYSGMTLNERPGLIVGTFLLLTGVAPGQMIRRSPIESLSSVYVNPGSFFAGCSDADTQCFDWEDPRRKVEISQGFWIGQTEVTQQASQKVMGSNPSRYKGRNRPMEQISWNAAVSYCATMGMRLPTESEWEFAARGGQPASRYGARDAVAWYDANSSDQTHPVAQKKPNAFGLYDMLGNVWEWVQDSYRGNATKRILRGGSFYNLRRELRVSNRLWADPQTAHRNMGFRCAATSLPDPADEKRGR